MPERHYPGASGEYNGADMSLTPEQAKEAADRLLGVTAVDAAEEIITRGEAGPGLNMPTGAELEEIRANLGIE